VTERLKVHDWKSCVPQKGTEGSNPSLSASKTHSHWSCWPGSPIAPQYAGMSIADS
jgi:hypothetical protein